MNPKLTVIIPLYNQEQYIEECIESILLQSYRDIRVIIVDDGSTDRSLQLCEKYAVKDERISIIHQENKGLLGARFTGLQETHTKYVTFVDADDFILNNAYIYGQDAMNKDVDMIFFEITRYFDKNQMRQEYHTIEEGYYDKARILDEILPKMIWNFERNTPGVDCSQCVRIVKTEILLNEYKNLMGQRIYYGEDSMITYPLFTKLDSLQVIAKSYYMHRQRGLELPSYIISDMFFDEVRILYEHLRTCLAEYLDKYDLKKQIDYFYMYSVELKKKVYGDYEFRRDFLFPFDKAPCGRRIVLYGAGDVGRAYYKQLESLGYCEELLWVDKRADIINDERVKNISEIQKNKYDFFVVAIENKNICMQVKEFLTQQGVEAEKIIF